MEIIKAKDFNNRGELKREVAELVDLTPKNKKDIVIKGSSDELKNLHLSQKTRFYGIKCEATDVKEPTKKQKVNRGKIHPHGIDGKTKKIKNNAK